MDRYVEHVCRNDTWSRWLVIHDLQWKVLQSQRLQPDADLPAAMTAATTATLTGSAAAVSLHKLYH